MEVLRLGLSITTHSRRRCFKASQPLLSCILSTSELSRSLHSQNITSNMIYISNDKVKLKADPNSMKLNQSIDKPLCIMMNWMKARPKHVQKYAELYLKHGYDVVSVSCTPWQLMWPKSGSQVVADKLLRFMEVNSHSSMVVHGFSVGAYVWAELLVHATNNKNKFQPVLDRIESQVWDSAADIHEIPVGFPSAVFPKNKFLQELFRNYIKTHLKVFHNAATKHYMRATEVYHETPCKAPALFLVSKVDPIGAVQRSRHVQKCWQDMGMKCSLKCWEDSPHVSHYIQYPKEYTATLYSHLQECGIISKK